MQRSSIALQVCPLFSSVLSNESDRFLKKKPHIVQFDITAISFAITAMSFLKICHNVHCNYTKFLRFHLGYKILQAFRAPHQGVSFCMFVYIETTNCLLFCTPKFTSMDYIKSNRVNWAVVPYLKTANQIFQNFTLDLLNP